MIRRLFLALPVLCLLFGCASIDNEGLPATIRYVSLNTVIEQTVTSDNDECSDKDPVSCKEERYQRIYNAIRYIARNRGVSVVLNLDDSVLYADPELDLTREVIEELKTRQKSRDELLR